MKGNATFHIPSSQCTRMPPTTPERNSIREMCVSCRGCILPLRVISDNNNNKKKAVVVIQVKPYTSSSLVLCLCSFYSVCSLLAGRSRFTLTPHTISLTRRLGEEHYMPEARASPNSSHSTAAVTTYKIADRKTEILSADSHKLLYFIFSFSFFHQICLSCFTPPFSPCPLSVYY